MITREIQNNERSHWDLFVSTHPGGHLLQSFAWGEVKARSGWLPIRLIVEDQGAVKAAIQVLKRKLPLTGRCLFYAPRGPIIDYRAHGVFDFLLSEVKRIAKEHRAIFLMIDPAVSDKDAEFKKCLGGQGFTFSDQYGIVGLTLPKRVFHVDLTPGEEEMLARMGPSHRRNIRHAEKRGVTVEKRSNEEGLKVFYQMYKKMSKRKGFYIRSLNYQKSLMNAFAPDKNFEVFLAMYQGQAIAGRLILRYGNKAWDMYAAADKFHIRLNASYLLVWEVFKQMKAEGCALFDFRGADSRDPASPLHGVHLFKSGFGPQFVEYVGEYYFVFSQPYFNAVNSGKALLKRALKIYKGLLAFNVSSLTKAVFRKSADEKSLRSTVLEKYGQQEELDAHTKIVDIGLLDAEDRIVRKYFKEGDQILNVGCGAGREAVALLKKGFQVTGIDLHPKMVETSMRNARIHNVQGRFAVMDACQMTFEDNCFDQITMFGSIITHIPKKMNRIAALKEARRVLRKGGHIVISSPNRKSHVKYLAYFAVINIWRAMCRKFIKNYSLEDNDRFGKEVSAGKSKGRVYYHMYSLKEMIEDIESAGLRIVDCRSNKELMLDIDAPGSREKDYFLYFIAKKED